MIPPLPVSDAAPSRGEIALAYQAAAQVTRDQLLPAGQLMPGTLQASASTPYVGWVGQNYCGGLVIIAKNPGGGTPKDTERKPAGLEVDIACAALQRGSPSEAMQLLDAVTEKFHRELPTIGMHALLRDCLAATCDSLEDVAFFNILPYRTNENETASTRARDECCRLIVGPLLRALRPDTILYLGDNGWNRPVRAAFAANWTYMLPRPLSDGQGVTKKGEPVLRQIQADNAARRGFRASRW